MHHETTVVCEHFGTLDDGRTVERWILRSADLEVALLTWGATIQRIEHHSVNVVLGFGSIDGYLDSRNPYFGATIGRYANRIANAEFELEGIRYSLSPNNGRNSLHGGVEGFDRRIWSASRIHAGVQMSRVAEHLEGGFPGRLDVVARFTLQGETLRIEYEASTSLPTIVGLTNHSYWNLAGEGSAEGHTLSIAASRYLPVDAELIPLGPVRSVTNSPFDFRGHRPIGSRLRAADPQLLRAAGYDHCFVLDSAVAQDGLRQAAVLSDVRSRRHLRVRTSEPALQLYSGNYLDGTLTGAQGRTYRQGDGIALEPEHYPDSPNRAEYPSVVLRPGETYRSATEYTLSTRDGTR